MPLLNFIPAPTWRDLVDILFLTLVAYQLYEWFRETRALRVLIGLVVLGGIYSVAKLWGLFLTTWVFQILWQVLLILLLILVVVLVPILWLNFLLGLPALGYTVVLLYTGLPIMMGISQEKGFLFSSAVLAVGLVALVTMMVTTALLWGYGFAPQFVD